MAISASRHLGLLRRRTRITELAIARRLAECIPRGGVIYDIGANIGLYSLVFARCGARQVHSFEPGETAAGYLRNNLHLNNVTNVLVHQLVVTDRSGTCSFVVDEETTATSHVARTGESGKSVRCESLDQYVAQHQLAPPDLVKIDVEGEDESVLMGMRRLLGHGPIVYVEGGRRSPDNAVRSMVLLADMGYTNWDLSRVNRLDAYTAEYGFLALPARCTNC